MPGTVGPVAQASLGALHTPSEAASADKKRAQ